MNATLAMMTSPSMRQPQHWTKFAKMGEPKGFHIGPGHLSQLLGGWVKP